MANIRVDTDFTIKDGTEVVFRSPVDCSMITGLKIYYPTTSGTTESKEFVLADAHGNNIGDIDHLFAENAVVKVILDVTNGMAFVQNADTNAYLEAKLADKLSMNNGVISDLIVLEKDKHYGDSYPENPVIGQLFLISLEAVSS